MAEQEQAPESDVPPGYRLVPETNYQAPGSMDIPEGWRVVPDEASKDLRNQMTQAGYQMARGATFNLIDKAGFAPPGAKEFEAENPTGTTALRVAGSLIPSAAVSMLAPEAALPAALTTASRFGSGLVANSALGAGFGALAGYGESTDYPARDTAAGAVMGGALGGAGRLVSEFATPSLEGLAARMSGTAADRLALGSVRNRYLQDVRGGGPTAAEMSTLIAQHPDLPLSISDVAGANLQGMAGSVARSPGEGQEIARSFFNSRDVGSAGRLLDSIDRHVSAGGDAYTAAQNISQAQRQAAAPLYARAYGAPALNPELVVDGGDLANLMARPSMRDAAGRALRLASEENRNPNSLGITFNAAGDPVFEGVPSWQTLDYLKRGLDDTLNAHRNDFGVLVRDEYVNALDNTRRQFVRLMDRENPDYKAARDSWSGFSQIQQAMRVGQNFKNYRPELLEDQLSQMNPGERQAALLGAADTMRGDVLKSTGGDEARRILAGDPNATTPSWREQQLRPFFANDQTYRQFINSVLAERRMFGTQTRLLGGSQTAGRVAEDTHGGEAGLGSSALKLGAGTVAVLGHEPFAGVPMVVSGARGMLNELRQPSEPMRRGIANVMFNPDTNENLGVLRQLEGARSRLGIAPQLTPGLVELTSGVPRNILGSYAESRYGQR